METRLRRVALGQEVLPEEVGDVDVLPPPVEAVQSAVGVLLKLREVGEVELVAVVLERAEDARAEVVVGVDEAAEVGRSEEHTSELQSRQYLVCRLLLEKK